MSTCFFKSAIVLLCTVFSLVLASLLLAGQSVHADPGVLYAAATAQGSGDCSSWVNACTLQTALTRAVSGDEIWVKAGLHLPGTTRPSHFRLKEGVAIYGGFAGHEAARGERNWQTHLTVLSGDIDQNDITDPSGVVTTTTNIKGDNAYHVVIGSGVTAAAVLDGFVITAGWAFGSTSEDRGGGGMYNESGSPRLANMVFSGNYAWLSGGGMYNLNASNPTLVNVVFAGNSASSGGGMYNASSNPVLTDVVFAGNSATSGGGIFNLNASGPRLTLVTFFGNSAYYGGGMYNNASSPALTNVRFATNTATNNGAGLYNSNTSSPTLTNVIFVGNTASNNGGGLYNSSSSAILTNVTFSGNDARMGGGLYNWSGAVTLANCILWGDQPAEIAEVSSSTINATYSDIQRDSGVYGGVGNINADPRFVDAAGGNLRLQRDSPAIDAGNNAAVPAGLLHDLDGRPRFVDIPGVPDTGSGTPPIVDMGAYEVQNPLCLPLVLRTR